MMLRARTKTRPTRIVRFVADSAYSTNSVRKSGARVADRLASASRLTSAATRTAMPVRISLVLSRNGRRGAETQGPASEAEPPGWDAAWCLEALMPSFSEA